MKNTFDDNSVVNEEIPEITMDQDNEKEGGISKVNLTMQVKMNLFDEALRAAYGEEYYWVMDFDDTYVYYAVEENNYRCPYSITEGEDGKAVAVIAFDDKERVVRSWSVFTENKKETEACDQKEDEACDSDSKEEEACGDAKEEESCGDKQEESCDDEESDDADDEEDECKFAATEVDLNTEPETIDTEDKDMSTIVEESTAAIAAPEAQTEVESVGDANSEVSASIDCEVQEAVVPEKEPIVTEPSQEPEAKLEQPNDEAKGEIFSAINTESGDADEHEKIEFNGEMIDIHQLLEKYNELNNNYTELQNSVKAEKAMSLAKIGENFINADNVVDENSKADFIQTITDKCTVYELNNEEEVLKFAKSLLAMYYYENRTKKGSSEEFSVSIEHGAHVGNKASGSKLKDAINKLNHLQTL